MNILLIDDTPQVQKDFEEYVNLPEYESIVKLISIDNVEKGIKLLESEPEKFDIAIVDMRFGQDPTKGNDFIKKINETCLRIPVFVYTNTPDEIDCDCYQWYCKDQRGVQEILDECISLGKTGLINILGHRGLLESHLKYIFQTNLLPSIKKGNWFTYAERDPSKTEKALLRYTLNHIQQILDEDEEKYYPEEVYIYPPNKEELQTGGIVQCLKSNTYLLVISPACDLANKKTERIQLLEIEDLEDVFSNRCKKNAEENQEKLKKNTYALFYHYLPKTGFFSGGFVNFRRIHSVKPRQVKNLFSSPLLQISPSFCKDIVSRFSSYYARQGQPEIEEIS